MWCGVVWCGVVWCGVAWRGVVWSGVVWCGVVWSGVEWRGGSGVVGVAWGVVQADPLGWASVTQAVYGTR